MAFELPSLNYAHDALEPHIDARTMEIHHGKHHAGYTLKLNDAIAGTDLEGKSIDEAAQFANTAAGLKCARSGGRDAIPSRAEVWVVLGKPEAA